MKSIILIIIAFWLPLGILAQNYNEYLEAAQKHLRNGNYEKAEVAYNIYVEMTNNMDKEFETSLSMAKDLYYIEHDVSYRNKKGIYRIGDYYNLNGKEGIVFDIDSIGKHGKIISMRSACYKWSTINTFTGANDMNDGRKNMKTIQQISNWEKLFPAFYYCYYYLGSDWYLPAYNELKQIWLNKKKIQAALVLHNGDFNILDTHYSSTEYTKEKAWMIMTQFETLHEEIEEINGHVYDLRGTSKQQNDAYIRAITAF